MDKATAVTSVVSDLTKRGWAVFSPIADSIIDLLSLGPSGQVLKVAVVTGSMNENGDLSYRTPERSAPIRDLLAVVVDNGASFYIDATGQKVNPMAV